MDELTIGSMLIWGFGFAVLLIMWISFYAKFLTEKQYDVVFMWSKKFAERNNYISGTLMVIECILSIINLPLLIATNWKWRL